MPQTGEPRGDLNHTEITGAEHACVSTAHVCFSLAGRQGHDRAPNLRKEIAAEMSMDEIAAAQRAARDCLSASIGEILAAVENGPASRTKRDRILLSDAVVAATRCPRSTETS
jgi:hypothetical protein